MIEIIDVNKSFGEKQVLHNVNATMYEGKTNLIIGTSGSGKTVLMKLMVGLMKPDTGKVLLSGEDINLLDRKALKEIRQQIGMLFQGSALFDSMTVENNVKFPLDMFTTMTLKEKQMRVQEVLDRVRLDATNKKMPSEISGGMKKRVALARAIVLNPKYLFCDEPNSGLDPQTSIVIDELIKELTYEYNMTTVINTHDMNTVMQSGDHITFMHKGSKRWEGSSNDILHSKDEVLDQFIFASDFLKKAKTAVLREGQ